jgi:hypothetical protein
LTIPIGAARPQLRFATYDVFAASSRKQKSPHWNRRSSGVKVAEPGGILMPRQSSAALGIVPAYAVELPPPAHLNKEKAVFRDIVASADSGHFRSEDRELLGLYCIHTIEARRLAGRKRRSPEHLRGLRETTKLLMTLSTKLRLGPKSRAPDHRRFGWLTVATVVLRSDGSGTAAARGGEHRA